jgi:hypothetical protein
MEIVTSLPESEIIKATEKTEEMVEKAPKAVSKRKTTPKEFTKEAPKKRKATPKAK